ncbi:MAG: hypothetical protein PHU69_05605 [Fermentimonas sp.]|nr:hypothetical protein [Fermentimonas sp.]
MKMTKKVHIVATAVGHLDFGIVEIEDEAYASQQIMKNIGQLHLTGAGVDKASFAITEVHTEIIRDS